MEKNEIVKKVAALLKETAENAPTSAGLSRLEEVHINSQGWGEPGYDEDCVVVLGDWNPILSWSSDGKTYEVIDNTPKILGDLLEDLGGVEIDWSDEWTQCVLSGKLYRNKPDSYGWQPSYVSINEVGDVGIESLMENENLLRGYIEDLSFSHGTIECADIDRDMIERVSGLALFLQGLERGLHHGQAADTSVISESLYEHGIFEFLFKIDSMSQFDHTFDVFVNKEQLERAKSQGPVRIRTDSAVSPAEASQRALSQSSIYKPKDPSKVIVHGIGMDGNLKTQELTPQELVEKGVSWDE